MSSKNVVYFEFRIDLEIFIEWIQCVYNARYFGVVACHQHLAIDNSGEGTIDIDVETWILCQRTISTDDTEFIRIDANLNSVLFNEEYI